MAKKELTQAQRDQKNERLRLARGAAKNRVGAAVASKPAKAPRQSKAAVTAGVNQEVSKLRFAAVKTATPVRKPGSGGARPNTGFQKLPVADKMVIISFRGTPAQKKKFAKLGGGSWARARIEAGTVKV